MAHWLQIACAWGLVEQFLGWLPCLALNMAGRNCLITQEGLQRLHAHLAQAGLPLPPPTAAALPFGRLVQLLRTMALSQFLRLDDSTLTGSWWHGAYRPRWEWRAIVRYLRQNPRREWFLCHGAPIAADQVDSVFPGNHFDTLFPVLLQHGRSFYRSTSTTTHPVERRGDVEGLRVRVRSLYFIIFDFEIILRGSTAHFIDLALTSDSSYS